ncbi:universal stress protein [Flagellimonas zhangzhouensis]|uniref:Nucleotide-binding universal stress protein, UspA family n=1 Tax=Flagellimonas zhangzhouensis TaxID=1073328 RepID=A0A1H2YAI4_9FLAO|nr:universal stress protein [Allomuricauda zhangzhouensis]SDQ98152.1 Nucleotide-binding universal stress protein, UspA family [Allomuricauda zhangzhouensis]SDX01684.1 Nucleotide-binding universal stress protein, UspA family [Allomuricauda zhangzhouensis]
MLRVILPTDFSVNAYNAITYAVKLLEHSTAVFYIMHAYTPPIYRMDYTFGSPGQFGLPDDQRYQVEEELENTRKRIESEFPNAKHNFVTHAAFNALGDEIESMSIKENIDFVVMGTQGATGAKEILFGSNTVRTIDKLNVPVLAIPSGYRYTTPHNMLFPTDFEVDYNKSEIDFLLNLSKLWHSKLHILHVAHPDGLTAVQSDNKTVLEGKLLERNTAFYNLPDQEIIDAINNFQKENPMEMLVMVKNKHSFIEKLFTEPVIKHIGFHSEIPFLVLPYNQ